MAYECQNFKNGQILTAECLNKMEKGIEDACNAANGLASTEKSLILTLFRNAAYTAPNMADTLAQLEELWSGGDVPDEPDEPDEPDVPDEPVTLTVTWTENTYVNGDGTISPYAGWYLSNEIDCSNYSVLRLTTDSVKWFATPPVWGNTAKGAETGFVKIAANSDNNPTYMGGSYSKEVWFDVSNYECVRLHTNVDGIYNNTAVTYKLEV